MISAALLRYSVTIRRCCALLARLATRVPGSLFPSGAAARSTDTHGRLLEKFAARPPSSQHEPHLEPAHHFRVPACWEVLQPPSGRFERRQVYPVRVVLSPVGPVPRGAVLHAPTPLMAAGPTFTDWSCN
jgi:hypothetical protein